VAFDWVKLDKTTPDKPEIALLSRLLSISQGDAFLEWARIYIWADGVTEDGFVPFLSLSDGDRLSRCRPGTFKALASQEIGWVIPEGSGFRFANWGRHNGSCAKARALDTEKKRNQRAVSRKCPGKCPAENGTKTGPEKRREEKSSFTNVKEPPIVPQGTSSADNIRAVFDHYRTHHPKAHLKPQPASKEWRCIKARLDEGYDVERLKAAIDGCHRTPHNLGQNDRGTPYLGLELIMRNGSNVERFAEAPFPDQPLLTTPDHPPYAD